MGNIIESVDLEKKKLVLVRTVYDGTDREVDFVYDFSNFVKEVVDENSNFVVYFYKSWVTTGDYKKQYFSQGTKGFLDLGHFQLQANKIKDSVSFVQTLEIQLG